MLKLGDDGESANSVGARGVEDRSAADDQQTSGIRTSPEVLPPTPVDGAPCLARPPSTSSNASTCKAREADVEPERATRESSRVSKVSSSCSGWRFGAETKFERVVDEFSTTLTLQNSNDIFHRKIVDNELLENRR